MFITVRPVVRKIGRNSASFQGGMSPTHIGSLLQTASRSEETDIGKKKETANRQRMLEWNDTSCVFMDDSGM